MEAVERWVPGSVGLLLTGGCFVVCLRLVLWAIQSKRWPSVLGRVTICETFDVGRQTSRGRKTRIAYTYEVDGRQYQGTRVRFGDAIEANVALARERAREFPVGTSVTVRYRPGSPTNCTLTSSVSGFLYAPLVLSGLVFALILGELLLIF